MNHTIRSQSNLPEDITGIRLMPFEKGDTKTLHKTWSLPMQKISDFIQAQKISAAAYFEGAFALMLSAFTGSEHSVFGIADDHCTDETYTAYYHCGSLSVHDFLRSAQNVTGDPTLPPTLPAELKIIDTAKMPQTVSSNADLTFELDLSGQTPVCSLQLNGHFPEWYGISMLETFETIAAQLCNCQSITDIDLLPLSQKKLLDKINMTAKVHPFRTVLEAFDTQVRRNTDSCALRFESVSMTYGEMAKLSDAVAFKLQAVGICPGDRVAICLPPCAEMPIAVLGVMKAGAVYIPMGSTYPESWKKQVIERAEAKAVLTVDPTECADLCTCPVIDVTTLIPAKSELETAIDPESEAAIIFTSGSTGEPKGVILKHKGLANVCSWFSDFAVLTSEDTFAMYQNFAFVSHIEPMFAPFFVGGCTDIIPEAIRLDMAALNDYYIRHNITVSKMGASAGRQFITAIKDTTLRLLYLSGEKLGAITLPKGYRVVDAYGPTENTAQITAIFADEKREIAEVGLPVDNVRLYVLNERKQRMPLGAPGRLFVAGDSLAMGYLNAPELTAAAFVSDPFSTDPSAKMYDTGDYVRQLDNGSIAFIGRKDDQIKIHGCRVELSEVAAAIEALPEVARCLCVGLPTDNGRDYQIAAYVNFKPEVNADDSFLKAIIKKAVAAAKPKYMIPTFVIPIDDFPLTANGKIDKKQLPKPENTLSLKDYQPPVTDTEKQICTQFETLFGLEQVGIDDDFIDLGGDSLHAMMMLSELHELHITAADILQQRTPRRIAACAENTHLDYMQDYPYNFETGFPFSTFQIVVYNEIHSKEEKDNELMPVQIDIPAEFSREMILAALDKMFELHPILCAYVDDSSDPIFNRIGDKPTVIVMESESEAELRRFHTETFDYRKTLSRYLLMPTENGHRLYSEFHHFIADVTALTVFKRHFTALLKGESIEFDTGMLKQSAFESWLETAPLYAEGKAFFDKMLMPLDHCHPLICTTPTDKPGNSMRYYDIDRRKLAEVVRNNHTSLGAFYTAAFGLCCARFSDSDCAVFLTAENDRDRLHLHDSFGAYTKLVPILIDCRQNTVSDFMHDATDTFYDFCNYDFYSLTQLYIDYPLTNGIYMDFLPIALNAVKLGDVPDYRNYYRVLNGEDEIAQCDFYCNIMETPKGFAIFIEHAEIYSREWIEHFSDTFCEIVKQLMEKEELSEI